MLKVDDAVGKQLADVVALQDRDGNDWFAWATLQRMAHSVPAG